VQFGVCAGPDDGGWIKKAGADFLEAHVQNFLRPMDEVWQPSVARADLPLPIAGYNCFLPNGVRMTGPDANLSLVEAYARRACERAAEMGSEFIVFGSGGARKVPDGWQREKADEQITACLRAIGPIAADAGVTIVMEPLNRGDTNVLNEIPETLEAVRRADAPGVAVLCDLFHFSLENEPLEHLDACRGLLAHVHIAEPDGRVPPGPGMSDYRPFLRKLKEIDYDRRISIECTWTDMRAELAPSLEFLRDEWAAV